MNADMKRISEPRTISQTLAVLGTPSYGGAAAGKNLRSSAFICG
jgi:hypothetical protein